LGNKRNASTLRKCGEKHEMRKGTYQGNLNYLRKMRLTEVLRGGEKDRHKVRQNGEGELKLRLGAELKQKQWKLQQGGSAN